MLLYGDSFRWAKYGNHILPSSLDLASNNKASLHGTFWNSLNDFLRTDLDGNLSSNLNPQISSKLDHYLSRLFEGLSETGSKGEMFDHYLLNEKYNNQFVKEIVDIVLDATQIPLSKFTNLFHQRFEKHSMLELTLQILQQTGSHPSWSSLLHLGFFLVLARRLLPMFYCNLLPAGAKKQETKKIVTLRL
jgi:hypothetical protein